MRCEAVSGQRGSCESRARPPLYDVSSNVSEPRLRLGDVAARRVWVAPDNTEIYPGFLGAHPTPTLTTSEAPYRLGGRPMNIEELDPIQGDESAIGSLIVKTSRMLLTPKKLVNHGDMLLPTW